MQISSLDGLDFETCVEQQKSNWLPKIAGGECVIGVGLSEYVGAREDSGIEFSNGKLSGRCLFLIDGKDADAYLLADKSGQLYSNICPWLKKGCHFQTKNLIL